MKKRLGLRALALIALALVIAVGALVASSSTTEATIQTEADGTGSQTPPQPRPTARPSTSSTAMDTAFVRFEIEATGAASGSFTHDDAADDGQSILCRADATPTRRASVTRTPVGQA